MSVEVSTPKSFIGHLKRLKNPVLCRKRHKTFLQPPLPWPDARRKNRYAIHALKDRRATMAGEIVQMKEGIAYREEQLSPLDAVLRELDPSYRADTIPTKRAAARQAVWQWRVEPAHCGRAETGREAAGEQ
jgi:hypothetical protein